MARCPSLNTLLAWHGTISKSKIIMVNNFTCDKKDWNVFHYLNANISSDTVEFG